MGASLKTYQGHCIGGGMPGIAPLVDAINPLQAREFLRARFPGYNRYYTSHEVKR